MTDTAQADDRQGNGAQVEAKRDPKGRFAPGVSGRSLGDPNRARRNLNADTIREMHEAFRRGGRAAIDKVMKNNPAMFLKLLVLLVPRELQIEHKGGVKAMSDDELERAIEAVQAVLDKKAASVSGGVVIEGEVVPAMAALPAPEITEIPKTRRKARKRVRTGTDGMGESMGRTDPTTD